MTHTSSKKERERLARLFHETYEMASAHFGYTTRTETREFDPDSPNGRLMTYVCNSVVNSELAQALKELKKEAMNLQTYKMSVYAEDELIDRADVTSMFDQKIKELGGE